MTLKREVISELGDDELLRPELIAKSLVANDQVKIISHCCRQRAPTPSFRRFRRPI